eukprot:Selendium_serpulae@DN6224_c1_g1_i1.p1
MSGNSDKSVTSGKSLFSKKFFSSEKSVTPEQPEKAKRGSEESKRSTSPSGHDDANSEDLSDLEMSDVVLPVSQPTASTAKVGDASKWYERAMQSWKSRWGSRFGRKPSVDPDPAVPPRWWDAAETIDTDDMLKPVGKDPLLTARSVRERKCESWRGPSNTRLATMHRIVRQDVKTTGLEWHEPQTTRPTAPPLTAFEATKTIRSMNSHIDFRSEPKSPRKIKSNLLPTMRHVALRGYLIVNCFEAYDCFSEVKKLSVLSDGVLKVVELEFDFENHRLIMTRRGDHKTDVRHRHTWLGAIDECNDTEAIKNHLESTGVISDTIDLNRLAFCGLYTKTDPQPALFVAAEKKLMEHMVVLMQHIVSYFRTRMREHTQDLLEFDGTKEEMGLDNFKDFTLPDVVNTHVCEDVTLNSDPYAVRFWSGGIKPCTVFHGEHVSRNVSIGVNRFNACLVIGFTKEGDEIPKPAPKASHEASSQRRIEKTPHREVLEVLVGPSAIDAAIAELLQAKVDGDAVDPETFTGRNDGTNTTKWSEEDFKTICREHTIVLRSPDWSLPMIVELTSPKKVTQFCAWVKVMTKTHKLVASHCTEEFIPNGGSKYYNFGTMERGAHSYGGFNSFFDEGGPPAPSPNSSGSASRSKK